MESHAELVAKKLAWEFETRKSVELQVRTEIRRGKDETPSSSPFDATEEHFIELAGKRFSDEQDYNSGKVVLRHTHYGDGSRCADVQYRVGEWDRQQYITIKRQYYKEHMGDRMERPTPLLFLHVGREPLHKALSKAEYVGSDKVIDRECDVFLFTKVRWTFPQDHVYSIDKGSAIPLKVVSYRDQAARNANRPLWMWTAESLEKVQGHFVPMKSTMITYNQAQEPSYEWKYQVQSIEFNKDYPPSNFWPTMQPGVGVMDTITSKGYEVPGAKKEETAAKAPDVVTSQPIEAVPPSDWASVAPWASFVFGCAILIAGGLLWWRHR